MSVTKLSEEQLRQYFSPDMMLRAEGSIGQFNNCIIKDSVLYGDIKGNHGTYNVKISTSPSLKAECNCRNAVNGPCKHEAALGLTFIFTPWVFKCEDQVSRDDLVTVEDVQYYITFTHLRQLFDELKAKDISITAVAELTRLPMQHISAAIKDNEMGIPNSISELLKLTCMYLLEKNISK